MNRTDRLYAIVEELRGRAPHWISANALADRALQQSGVPICATPRLRDADAEGARAFSPCPLAPG